MFLLTAVVNRLHIGGSEGREVKIFYKNFQYSSEMKIVIESAYHSLQFIHLYFFHVLKNGIIEIQLQIKL